MFHVVERRIWQRIILIGLLLGTSLGIMVMYDHDIEPVISNHLRIVGQLLGTGDGTMKVTGDAREIETVLPDGSDERVAETEAETTQVVSVPPDWDASAVEESVSVDAGSSSRLSVYRLERDRNTSRYLEQLNDLITAWGEKSDPIVQNEIVRLLGRAERQMQAEGLLRVQGVDDAIVVLSDSEAIVVVGGELSVAEVSHIGGVVARVAGIPLEHITISDGLSFPQ